MYFTGTSDYKMINEIKELHAKAVAILPEINDVELTVKLNSRMRTRGGTAATNRYAKSAVIELNYRLHKDNPEQVENTYLHELAHVIATIRYNKQCGHGYLWKNVMSQLGANDERCHTMDTSAYKNKTNRIAYECGCQTHNITKQKHNKIIRGFSSYRCKSCKQELVKKVMKRTAQEILSQSVV